MLPTPLMNHTSHSIFDRFFTAHFLGVFLFVSIFGFIALAAPVPATNNTSSTSSAAAQATLAQTDITEVGMNMYTTAYNWEVGNFSGYTTDAFRGVAKKLNTALRDKDTGMPILVQKCG